jgi:hypothetical protein
MNDITLVAVSGIKIPEIIKVLELCYSKMKFPVVKLITHENPILPDYMTLEKSDYVIDNMDKYSKYLFRELGKHISTSHCLVVQHDSWILRPELWDDAWLEYDYIGAPWPERPEFISMSTGEMVRVGNGGFSLRSKKLLDIPKQYDLPLANDRGFTNEDGNICSYHRKKFLELGIKYAPIEVAARFSHELDIPENADVIPFGFHRYAK